MHIQKANDCTLKLSTQHYFSEIYLNLNPGCQAKKMEKQIGEYYGFCWKIRGKMQRKMLEDN